MQKVTTPAISTIAASTPLQPASIDTAKPVVASRNMRPWAMTVSSKGKIMAVLSASGRERLYDRFLHGLKHLNGEQAAENNAKKKKKPAHTTQSTDCHNHANDHGAQPLHIDRPDFPEKAQSASASFFLSSRSSDSRFHSQPAKIHIINPRTGWL